MEKKEQQKKNITQKGNKISIQYYSSKRFPIREIAGSAHCCSLYLSVPFHIIACL